MKIAIIAPTGVPYVVGGAEKLWWGLLDALRAETDHQVELVKLPSPEGNFLDLLASYQRFSNCNLDHFDLVISTKYPAWMVHHRRHYCYLQHTLRGLYDTYPAEMPLQLQDWPPALGTLQRLLAITPTVAARAALFTELDSLGQQLPEAEYQALFAFPGPLARQIIHWLDASALRPGTIKKFMAISATVAAREDYFPADAEVQVIHHPSDLSPAATGEGRYLLAVSRLEAPKRIDLLIRAMGQVSANVPLLIAGTGPQEAELRALASGDPRIRFCGRVSDEELRQLYSGALLVPFLPRDEDYGLITVEALQAGKPVLSTTDAGGVVELIEEERTGWLVTAEEAALAGAIEQALAQPQQLADMAAACQERGAAINWPTAVAKILDPALCYDNDGYLEGGKPRHIVVAVSFPVYPAASGGANRIYNLYRHIAWYTPVTLVTLCSANQPALDSEIAPGLREIRIPKSARHEQLERGEERRLGASVGDIVAMEYIHLTPAYLLTLRDACLNADLVVASHPYMYPAISAVWRGRVLYESHNVEYDMKRDILGESREAKGWLALTNQVESACCHNSAGITACSEADRQRLAALYDVAGSDIALIPNGADCKNIPFTSLHDRARVQTRMAELGRFSVLFMGSWHGPNIEAARYIDEVLAPACPELDFWLVGSVCRACPYPAPNVRLFRQLSEGDKNAVLRCARLAINPVVSGSGSNLKMAEYVSAGLPVLTTPFGARGLDFSASDLVWEAELVIFPEKLKFLVNELAGAALKGKVSTGVRPAHADHDWQVIAENYYRYMVSMGMNLESMC